MKLKKMISICMIISMLASVFGFQVLAIENQTNELNYETEIGFLKSLGIYDSIGESISVSRAEFLEMIALILFNEIDFANLPKLDGVLFNDVGTEHKYYSYIKACKDLNIISGNHDNNFYPDREITVTEAITVLINALGYTPNANAMGGYPSGYFSIAKNTGISKGVQITAPVNGKVAAKLIYNSLFADLVGIDAVTSSEVSVSINKDKNILSERLGIKEYDVKVIDNGITSLTGTGSADPTRVVLKDYKTDNKITAYVGETNIGDYIGSRIKVFVKYSKESGRDEVVYFTLNSNSSEITLNADTIIGLNDHYIEYEPIKNSDDYTKLYFNRDGAVVIYNGIQIVDYQFQDLLPEDGFVRLVDYEKNNEIDFIEIISYNLYEKGVKGPARNIVVDQVDAINGYIGCRLNPSAGLKLESDTVGYKIVNSEEIKAITDIQKNDVVSIAQSPADINGEPFYYLTVKRDSKSGKVVTSNSDTNELDVNGVIYEVSKSYTGIKINSLVNISYGVEMTFLLDATGKIAFIENLSSTSKNYAYIIDGAIKQGADQSLVLKIMTKSEEIKTLRVSEKAIIDNNTFHSAQDALDLIKKRPEGSVSIWDQDLNYQKSFSRPAIIEVNSEDVITRIDTDNINSNYSKATKPTFYSSETFIPYSPEEIDDVKALKAGYRSPKADWVTRYDLSLNGRFYITSDTVVLSVPDIDLFGLDQYLNYASNKVDSVFKSTLKYEYVKSYEDNLEDENYKVMSSTSLNYLKSYDIQGYDIDPNTQVAGMVVLRGRNETYAYGKVPNENSLPMSVFLKMSDVYDEESGKTLKKLYYTTDGINESSVLADTDDLLFSYKYLIEGCSDQTLPYKKEVPPLKKGDIIRVMQQAGMIGHIERVFRFSDLKSVNSSCLYPTNPRMPYTDNLAGMSNSMPNDQRTYYAAYMSGYVIGVSYPKQVKGNMLTVLMGKEFASDVKLSNPNSYIPQNCNLAGVPIVHIQIDQNGELKVKPGSLSDIKTIDQINQTEDQANGTEGASLVIFKQEDQKYHQVFIVNDERIGG